MLKTNITILIITLIFTIKTQAQSLNLEIITNGETPYLLGKINKTGLTGEHYQSWFTKNYNEYNVDDSIIKDFKSNLANYEILLFMGTWCGDSKQEVPKFLKILDACDFPESQLTIIALSSKPNMYKKSPNHEEAGLNIHRVPTFIFIKNGKEVNRIVEHPVQNFEKDIRNIVTINNYKSNYQIVTKIDRILKQDGLNELRKQRDHLIKTHKDSTSNMFELNTYGRVLYSNNLKEEAIMIFDLNTKLFPNQPRTYMSLANTLGANGERKMAIQVLEEAIKLFPNNNDLIQNLEVVKTN
nr:thioredoxin family protein [uncultured Psychroserpens sp.]